MEVQGPVTCDWSMDFYKDLRSNHPVLRMPVNSDPRPGMWGEPTGVKRCGSHSFARDARMRLDYLKFGSHPQAPCCGKDGTMHSAESEKDQGLHTVLDLVELLELKEDVENEETWLYESPRRPASVDAESPLRWCRRVLDNPSPETEAACRLLINKLNQSSSRSVFHGQPAAQHHTDSASVYPYMGKRSTSSTPNTSLSSDNKALDMPRESITSSYKLQDITDVHIMARIQEDSLRQDYISMPACPEPQVRLRQQVTQLKLLKRAQTGARTDSPLRTSLRSLQAVRNSRSLDTDDYLAAHQTANAFLPSGVSSSRMGRTCKSSSLPAAPMNSKDSSASHSEKRLPVQKTAMREVQRSQSLSPCRLPHSAKRYLSFTSCVYASPERPTTTAWGSNVPSTRR
ncbi:SLAIN motif-containing protein-like isoform X2 [Dunckerocampus dactyliophorus]|uniref:SLAIN motif-containing protein-like isoform X2 n=1 Tax=Dunckerocampus dactyliophorus TaxID=161453 RepID=UPI002406AB14|nr:SLAIN motif-containing protein-like isoform X2 [Dunckerocampus dactyliophorus]